MTVQDTRVKPRASANADIPRTIDDVQPYYIFDEATINRSGATNIEDFLRQRLTMNTTAQLNGQISGINLAGNTSAINLRGIGTDKTLILVNGRRLPGVGIGTGDNQPDLNGIALSSIERVEVLPTSASGIYGGSAVGGVVNVILKQNYSGGEVRVGNDNVWNADAPRRSASASYGFSMGEKTRVNMSTSWSDAKELILQDRRDLFDRNVDTILRNAPNSFTTAFSPWLGALPNLLGSSSSPTLTLLNGTSLNSRLTYIPAGTSPGTTVSQLGALLLPNAGRWNRDLPPTTQDPTGLLRPFGATPEMKTFRAGIRHQFLSWMELYSDFLYTSNATDAIFNPYSTLTVPAGAPNNPFTTDVTVRSPGAIDYPVLTKSLNRAITLGTAVKLARGWTGAVEYGWSENRFYNQYYDYDIFGLTTDLRSGALNPLVDTLMYPLALDKYLAPLAFRGVTEVDDFSVRGSGPLPALPFGAPTLSFGLEHRVATSPARQRRVEYPTTPSRSFLEEHFARKSVTDSAYVEITIPLVKQDWLPGVRVLELQAAARTERFKVDTGTAFRQTSYNVVPPVISYLGPTLNNQPVFSRATYTSNDFTGGLRYQPVKDLSLRASVATAFLPPAASQLIKNPAPGAFSTSITDPRTNTPGVPVLTVSGGNPDLVPQSSTSFNAGLVWEPEEGPFKGLRFNAEYYRIEQENAISTLTAQQIANLESVYPERVIRNASGTITVVDVSQLNLYKRETDGWDVGISYDFDTAAGRFYFQAAESIILHLKNQFSLTQPQLDAVGYPSESGAAKYKSNFNLTWEREQWTVGWTARYFGGYRQSGSVGGPGATQRAASGLAPLTTYTLPQGGDAIPSQIYHDLMFDYSFGQKDSRASGRMRALTSGLALQLGIRNVFDKVPPFDYYYSSNYYLSPYGDVRLRSYWLSAKKEF